MQIRFDSQIVLITGASKGIGLACALGFGRAGATVVGISRSEDNLREAREACQAQGVALKTYALDLTDGEAALALVARIESEVGPIDVLVNSAGAARRYAPEELNPAAFRQAMDAKYFTYIHAMEPVIRRMGERGRGSIVNVVGQGGRKAGTMHIAGGSANAGLLLASMGYARAYADKGVRVNAINPGLTETGRVAEGLVVEARATGRSKEDILARNVAEIPMRRAAKPEEVANVAMFLASDLASYVTAAMIPMDGGATPVI